MIIEEAEGLFLSDHINFKCHFRESRERNYKKRKKSGLAQVLKFLSSLLCILLLLYVISIYLGLPFLFKDLNIRPKYESGKLILKKVKCKTQRKITSMWKHLNCCDLRGHAGYWKIILLFQNHPT